MLHSDFYEELINKYSKHHSHVKHEANPVYIKRAHIDSLLIDLIAYFANVSISVYCVIGFPHVGGDTKQFSPTSTAFIDHSAEYSF